MKIGQIWLFQKTPDQKPVAWRVTTVPGKAAALASLRQVKDPMHVFWVAVKDNAPGLGCVKWNPEPHFWVVSDSRWSLLEDVP